MPQLKSPHPISSRRSLQGLRIIEFFDPKGALAGKLLADMGADVVLIQLAVGNPSRNIPPLHRVNGQSLFFAYFNANKRSVTLDITKAKDRQKLLRLIRRADVLIESFQPGYLPSLGLTDTAISKANSKIIYASITGFG